MITFAFVLRILFVALVAFIVGSLIVNRQKVGYFFGHIGKFRSEVMLEMKRVAWPSRDEIISSTIMVGVGTFALTIVIAGVDKIFGTIIKWIFS